VREDEAVLRKEGAMLACVKTAIGKIEMLDLPIPKAGPGEIVIKTTMATVCGSDMHWLDEIPNEVLVALAPGVGTPQSFPMGHEGVGTVHEVGPGVTRVQVGDRVIACAATTASAPAAAACSSGARASTSWFPAPMSTSPRCRRR
jgi:threonine dehydrogenase-like Zn-dependent dehydrogenase